MKGHLSFKCPERRGTRRGDAENDCERCGSRNHQSRECPNIWRMYEYLSEKESRKVLQRRLEAKGKPLGQGGEAYVCSDAYCYNCGKKGHWGDDCGQMLRFGTQNKPTAFSLQNLRTGPFYDDNDDDHDDFDERYDVVASQIAQFSASERENHRQREQDHATIRRDRQNLSNGLKGPDTPPDWYAGNSLPDRVGNKGKRKRLEQLQNQVQEEADNEQDDWFASQKDQRASKRAKDNTHARPSPSELPNTNRGRQFSIAIKGVALSRQSSGNNNRGGSTTSSTRQHQPPPPPHPLPIPARRPSLIDRLGDSGLSGKDTSRPPPRESDGADKRHWNDMSRVALKAGRGSNQNGHQLADNEKEKKNRSINRSGSSSKQRRDGKNSTGSSTGNKPRYGGGYTA
ncbi:hypothetical protein DL96DRAFT_1594309 [Flagelloscypha sp. PMI_526]|nr:hypothetical protein DL96DRAFT_1594309 [Flagelloscypha sp. PMI_526]